MEGCPQESPVEYGVSMPSPTLVPLTHIPHTLINQNHISDTITLIMLPNNVFKCQTSHNS